MKKSIDELAIFNGTVAFSDKVHVGRPNIGNRERFLQRVNTILDNRWLTNNGPFVQEFERRVAELVGAKHCIATCNGTVALEIATRAMELKGEVIIPSFTFIATAHALQWQEITPVFCDIIPETHNIDPNCIEKMITPRTTGIMGVHLWGNPCDIEAIKDIANKYQLNLIFDASHAFGASYKGVAIGSFGNAEIFSFHATKFMNTLEGGAIVTNNDELAEKIRLMKNFGFAGYDKVIYIGINGKMNEVSAAMGLTSLEMIDEMITVNKQNYLQYKKELSDIQGINIINYDEQEKRNYQYVVAEIDEEVTQASRDIFIKVLWAENVLVRRYFYPGCHQMEPYRSYFPHASMLLPNTERVAHRVLLLPTGQTVSPEMISSICQIIRLVATNGKEISSKLVT